MKVSKSFRFGSIIVLALVLGSGPSLAQAVGPEAIREQIAALHTLADWANDLLDQVQAGGDRVDGAYQREIQAIQGQLIRYDRILRNNQGEPMGIEVREVEALADRLARGWLDIRQVAADAAVDRYDSNLPAFVPPAPAGPLTTIPRGTNILVELTTWLSSKTANVGDRFSVLVADPVFADGRIAVPSGALLEGMVTATDRAGRVSDAGNLHLYIDRLRGPDGQIVDMRGLVVGLESGDELKGKGPDAGKTAVGAAVGGLLGGLLEGKKGALIGLGVGAGGTLLAQKGKEVDLPQGSLLRVEIQDAVGFSWDWPSR